jgi:hypothetical protein
MKRAAFALRRARSRGLTPVEGALLFAALGLVLAVAVPAFVRELRSSRFVEPVDGLNNMAAAAVAYANGRPVLTAFPASAPLTPAAVPRGTREVDPPGTWDAPTWVALGFRPAAEEAPHAFAFAFDSALAPSRSTFVAHAHGDLDGDGIQSTFEVRGHVSSGVEGDGENGPVVEPGMYVEAEAE